MARDILLVFTYIHIKQPSSKQLHVTTLPLRAITAAPSYNLIHIYQSKVFYNFFVLRCDWKLLWIDDFHYFSIKLATQSL